MASYLRKYGTGSGADVYINIPKAGSANHAVSGDWSPAAGDVKISKDGGAAANIGTLPTAIAMGNSTIWKFVFTDAELQATFISVTISDSATKAVDDTGFSIETYGHASGLHAFDLDTATQSVNVTQFGGSNGTFASGRPETNTTHLAGSAIDQSGGLINANVKQVSGDATAADNLENAYNDTAGPVPWHGLIDQGTAQSATATTLVIRAAAAFGDNALVGATVLAYGSTQGYWQAQVITANVGSTDTLTVPGFPVTPSGTIAYKIVGSAPGTGVAQTGDVYPIVASLTYGNSALKTLIDTIDDFLDTEIAAIKAKTDNLPSDPADASDIASSFSSITTTLSTIAGYLDTEVAAIKAKTDNLPSDPADASDVAASVASLASTLATIATYVDTEVAAIKAKTDQLTFTTANKVDSTIQIAGDFAQAAADKVWSTTTRTLTSSGGVKKNTALAAFPFRMVDSADHVSGKTGLTVTATRSLDGAAFAACANAVVEVANGVYKIDLAAADLNADTVTLKLTATGSDDTIVTIKTAP